MDLYLFHPDRYQKLYNCTLYNVDQVPLEERQHFFLGIVFITMAIVMEILYIPCTIAIWKHRENACYKIMFYIAVTDMMAMLMNGVATGYLAIIGAVFCSHPNITYILGAYGMSLWGAETTAELILALNRCLEICSPGTAERLFKGKRTWLWLVPPSIYGLYWFMFTMPHPFSAIFVSWFFNPHIGYIDDFGQTYRNNVHDFHNYFVVAVILSTYLIFSILLCMKSYKFQSSSQHSYSQKMIFIQVVLISSINAVAAGVYVYMQYTTVSKALILVGQMSWLFAHGVPSLIYLGLNKTIRTDCKKMVLGLIRRKGAHSTTNGVHSTMALTRHTLTMAKTTSNGNGNGNRVGPIGGNIVVANGDDQQQKF